MKRAVILIATILVLTLLMVSCQQTQNPVQSAPEGEISLSKVADDPAPPVCGGCTPGYWKNHLDTWEITGYNPGQPVSSVWSYAAKYPDIGNATLHQALYFKGGKGTEGAARIMMRSAVAALLNWHYANKTRGFIYNNPSIYTIINYTNQRFKWDQGTKQDREMYLDFAKRLDIRNNAYPCPLN